MGTACTACNRPSDVSATKKSLSKRKQDKAAKSSSGLMPMESKMN